MRKIIWLDSAVDDVARLRKFISKKNPDAAKKAAHAIKTAAARLVANPLIGKPIDNLLHYRDFLVRFGAGGYVFRYRVIAQVTFIVHVRHYREDDFTS